MAETAELRLLTRQECHLCEVAESDLRRMGIRFQLTDVDSDVELQRQYGDAVPVLLMGDMELARAPLDVSTLRGVLNRYRLSAGGRR
jgi:hypothetical protein